MSTGKIVGKFAVEYSRLIASLIIGITVILAVLAILPTIWPRSFEPLNSLKIDTDPENMLPEKEPVRVFHDRMKKIMSLNDMIVIGVVNEKNEIHGVFTPDSLEKIFALTRFVRGLRWRDQDNPGKRVGVVEVDMIAPSMVDNVESGGAGIVRFEWLMQKPPETQEQATAVKRKALDLPFLRDTLVSADGKAVALYVPITHKDMSYRIYNVIKKKLENPSRLFPSEIGDLNEVLHQLTAASLKEEDPLVRIIWQELSSETRQQLLNAEQRIERWEKVISRYDSISGSRNVPSELKDEARKLLNQRQTALKALVSDMNEWFGEPVSAEWLQAAENSRSRLNDEGRHLLDAAEQGAAAEQIYRLKRLWLEAAFTENIIPSRAAVLKGDLSYHITGLPVAEDTFGVQMFKQMAISAPLAMVIIFLLMWFFFRSAIVILPAMYDALIATAATMSLLVITGNTIHIMSSMIPIFIVPIAVLDDVHVISEFFDRYQLTRDRKKTIIELMGSLFTPMLYTTLTTAVGFASLALTPIPPVQVFGLFVAFGVIVAWICSILLVPAFISALPQKTLENFGAKHGTGEDERLTLLGRVLRATGSGTYKWAKPIVAFGIGALALSGYGISQIQVNDNPTKWFDQGHPIRVADKVLNSHFGGTYMAYLSFRPENAPQLPEMEEKGPQKATSEGKQPETKGSGPSLPGGLGGSDKNSTGAAEKIESIGPELPSGLNTRFPEDESGAGPELPSGLKDIAKPEKPAENTSPKTEARNQEKPQIFKNPATLRWIGALQSYMNQELGNLVGKSNSVTDIVETVHRELMVGVKRNGHVITEEEAMRVPDTRGAVAQSLLQFQNSHRPQDLWHFVTPDHRTAVIWLQLTSGDNRDMSRVVRGVNNWLEFWNVSERRAVELVENHPEGFQPVLRSVARFIAESDALEKEFFRKISASPVKAAVDLKQKTAGFSPPDKLRHDWFGLTYINVVWQEKMVVGMLKALLGSFLAVFLMMTLLYRSALWGALCMAPLTVTIAMIYGLIGLVGKDYDMPVAVLSSLSLGLAVDYAIHFLTRSRMMYLDYGSWEKTAGPVFGEPARAISRNAIVVGIGFMPLLLAPLVPYQTVGLFIAAILLLAGVSTMILLPALLTMLENQLFPRTQRACTMCYRGTCIISAVAAVALISFNIQQFIAVGWTTLTWISVPTVIGLIGFCTWMSKGEKAKTEKFVADEN